jgi:hypothetical protein
MLMIITDQMQSAVYDEVSPMRTQGLALRAGLAAHHVRADYQVTQRGLRGPGGQLGGWK